MSLSLQLLDEGARRLAALAAVLAVTVIAMQVLHRLAQPQIAPILDDPISRLAALSAVLMAAGVVALYRYHVVTSRALLSIGMVFEIAVAFSIAMVETSRPFDSNAPLLGLSAVGPWILVAAALIPSRPAVRFAVAFAAATAWPVAYWINSLRLDFVTESWGQTSIWPAMNYLFAGFAYLIGRAHHREVAPSADAMTERQLGSYQLLQSIGEGGMGEVWRASHKMLARPAAVKLVKFDAGREEIFERRFHREANAIAGLQSPHTVYLYDFGTTPEGRLYYVMELLDGISLQTLINTFGVLPPSRVVAILRQICRSLGEAHEKKIVHRDLKPSNVMICHVAQSYDFVKVLDFGLAKPVGGADALQLTAEGLTLGTPEYMAPEVARASSVDGRADLYALGCIAYVLLTGTLVFPDSNPVAVALKHMRTPPEPPSRRTSQFVPADLERVVLKCLEKEPGARPSTARDVERMLAACDVPPWTEEDAASWWTRHLPPASPLRAFSETSPHAPPSLKKE
jgi:serine/threonine-protein kinase